MKRVLLAEPRGFCAGVRRAISTVEQALDTFGAPVYVRRQIVHNHHVIRALEARGARFVETVDEIPAGAVCVFAAHGIAPAVRQRAAERGLRTIDATCPLVSKVHQEAVRFARDGRTVVLVGHTDHEEVEGTVGHAPTRTVVVETEQDARELPLPVDTPIGVLTQTTLAVGETARVVEVLRSRFRDLREPSTADICYASTNRQRAVTELAVHADLVLVVGSRNSSNSVRMVEVVREAGGQARLLPDVEELAADWLDGVGTVGVSAGASAPEALVDQLLERLAALGYGEPEIVSVTTEDMVFGLPRFDA
jgi:4-hydroxy-3-methylbut-2-enyl diphosphate reductase